MNLVFIHSGEKVKQDTLGNIYTDGSYSMDIWNDRYLQIADHLTLIMRKDPVVYDPEEAKKKFNMIDTTKIDFVELPDEFSSILSFFNPNIRRRIKSIVFGEIEKSDGAVIRLPGTDFAVEYANKLKKPYIVEVVGCPFDGLWNYNLFGKLLAIPSWLRLKRALMVTKNAVYVTEKFLQKRYPTKAKSINCSNVSIKKSATFEELYVSKNKNKAKIVIGTAAALDVRYKGQQYVIKALSELKKQGYCNFEYQIAGGGDPTYLKTQIEKYNVEDEVKIVGSIPHDQISEWYKSLDLYIQPSKQEGLPRALIEAMNAGVASVGSKIAGIPELLDDESVFKKGNVKEISRILLKFSDENFRMQKAEKCHKKSWKYDKEILNKRRIDFMKRVFLNENNDV